ncbi:amino acid transporter [Hortaea werneckii]|uniref:Amino acid permease/ SLC12A domain-containing protein n=3 Tax=Hortaea werneckii TaxID=91943 RepID=A0A3M7HUC5_HORWE|nr:amino acid transporter [Hortaea werneckii]KAI7347632.1 amino acid transporter [Hortaea werneckii]KAI7549059.1 amino acid transporter [Hortaea werneckii]KAI7601088.1 amino acid transporter [Hortaea werneckii]KAI7679971.1 amino acid transporter [Hortaea werneckii]
MQFMKDRKGADSPTEEVAVADSHNGINASGHQQELERNFGLWAIVGMALTAGNTWIAFGGSLAVAIYNGGSPGVIYEFIVVSILYWFVAASIAELASAMPSAGGVYHWATVTAGRHGRWVGFFAGWWNFLAWIFGLASTVQILSTQLTSMYAVSHPGFVTERWHVFVTYVIATWLFTAIVLFANRALPKIEQAGLFFLLAGVFISIVVCAVMPSVTGNGYATSASVWKEWVNSTGYTSDGFVFLAGMLNGAFAVGTPDITSHMAEEIPRPSSNIPKAVLAQYITGFVTALCYSIAILYAITDLDAVLNQSYFFTLTAIYEQATGSPAGTVGLLVVMFLPLFVGILGVHLTASRMFWTLARDRATPFSTFFRKVNPHLKNPANSIVFCAVLSTILGCIYLGSDTAFMAFVGSFAVLGFLSYISAILPHLLSRRQSVRPGKFSMGSAGFVVNTVAVLFILAFTVIFCFPFALPVDAASMNYTCLIVGGFTILVAALWAFIQKGYVGPQYVPLEAEMMTKNAV